jgi:Fe2+ transport system protein FeoA
MQLSEMREGQYGKILHIRGESRLRRRILEMGLTKGSEIYIEKYAPLKDPMELTVRGCHVSLRVKEAAEIEVESVQ